MASGFAVLLLGRMAGRFYAALFAQRGWFVVPDVTTVANVKLAAIGLTLVGCYVYAYSRVVHGNDRFGVMAVLTLAWAGLMGLELAGVNTDGTLLALTAAGATAVVAGSLTGSRATASAGRVGVVLGGAAGGLLACNRVLGGDANWPLLVLTAGHTALVWLTAACTRKGDGRAAVVGLTAVLGCVVAVVLNAVSGLSLPQKLELFATAGGLALVAAGLVRWRQEATNEPGQQDTLVDVNLWIGSLLATIPMTLGLLINRFTDGGGWWQATHEMGVLAIGLSLVGVGVLARLRATTLAGGGALGVYLLSLVVLIGFPEQLQNAAVYMMAGGGALFGGAVLLSVYRDRLLALPGRV
ncbi:MAG: hypothetical protein AAGG46_11175, partial [Planctomycetota bacterium]